MLLAAAAALTAGVAACASEDTSGDDGDIPVVDGGHDSASAETGTTLNDASHPDTGSTGGGDDASATTDASDATTSSDAADASSAADTSVPDTSVADTSVPDTSIPDTSVADTSIPDTSVADSSTGPHIVFGSPSTGSPSWGGSGGTAFSDPCPTGQALIGMTGKMTAFIDQISAVCGTVTAIENTTVTPSTYTVSITSTSTLGTHGNIATGGPWSARCGQDQVVVGIGGRSGNGMDAITLKCASLVIGGTQGAYTVSRGTINTLPTAGGSGGSAFADFTCPAGQFVRTMNGRAGDSIDQLSLVCDSASFSPN